MIEFRKTLQDYLLKKCQTSVGEGTHASYYAKTFDSHLHDVEFDETPFVVVNVRTDEKTGEAEMGSTHDLRHWTVHIYYIHTTEEWEEGEIMRDHIMKTIQRELEYDRTYGRLAYIDEKNVREYVYDSEITAILFDGSGQEEYYSLTSELYLSVYTAKT